MFSSLSWVFVSILNLFHPTMSDDITNILFDSNNKALMDTAVFQFILSSWSRRTEGTPSMTDWRRFEIICLIYSKNLQPPEHEYIIIEIKDRVLEKNHFLILEHFASRISAPTNNSNKELMNKFMQLLMTVKKTLLVLMEEGFSSQLTI